MRTSLIIDDRLLRAAKREAAARGVTLSALVDEALRAALRRAPAEPAAPFEMPTFGRRGARVRHEPSDFADALAAEDRETLER